MVKEIVVDLVGYDDAKNEISLLRDGIATKNRLIATQDSLIARFKDKSATYQKTIVQLRALDATNKKTIQDLQKQLKSSRRKIGSIGILSSIMLVGLAKILIFD